MSTIKPALVQVSRVAAADVVAFMEIKLDPSLCKAVCSINRIGSRPNENKRLDGPGSRTGALTH